MNVSNNLGAGVRGAVYQEALEIELSENQIFFEAQIINYLKASKMKLGVIINFGSPKLEWKRFANTKS